MPSVWFLSLAGVLSTPDAARLHDELSRLANDVRVMYVAAHPDDEHTELLAHLAGGRHAQVVYLSLTRGSGGQNRIGDEQGPTLGVLRTEELLAAREIDGADQLFTRALDFGYSKSAEEALSSWGEDAILDDVVYAIRAYRPHVIITRFPETGDTHGHHLASARLARRAFSMAADPSAFPAQLTEVSPWQAVRLVHDIPRFMSAGAPPPEGALRVDVDGFHARRGLSHGEIAALSRSQHRSQGFGTQGRRGTSVVWMMHLEGARAERDLLEGIPSGWSELPGGAGLQRAIVSARDVFDPGHPERTVPALVRVRRALLALPESPARDLRLRAIDRLIVGCAGLFADVRAEQAVVRPGDALELTLEVLARSPLPVRLEGVHVDVASDVGRRTVSRDASDAAIELREGTPSTRAIAIELPVDAPPSVLPWLRHDPLPGQHMTDGPARIAAWPEAPLAATLELTIDGERIAVRRAVRHVRADPVLGERAREVEIHPALLLTPARPVALAAPGGATTARFTARGAPGRYEVALEVPEGWTRPASQTLELGASGEAELTFELRASPDARAGVAQPTWRLSGEGAFAPALEAHLLDHPHVPERAVLLPARTRLVQVALRSLEGQRFRVGYVEGTGDGVAAALTEAGVEVALLTPAQLAGDLARFDAIVFGVRAFNRDPALHARVPALLAYAERGGTVIVQYQTANRLETLSGPIGPGTLAIGRGRVTDQNATVELLAPEHPALRTPHAITASDFEGWVQERGLYFGERWGGEHTPLLRMSDPGEPPQDGALLVAAHGAGHFVYTGLSFFRQLPAGTSGAYRLFENLIALGTPGASDAMSHTPDEQAPTASTDEPPPFGGTWTRLYIGVATTLGVLMALFFWIGRRFG